MLLTDMELEETQATPMDIDDWEGDYYLDNNRMTSDILVNSYFSFMGLGNSNDISDLLDEESLLSFNNGTYAGEDDMGDPLDVAGRSNHRSQRGR
jgi:hypothetical protein